MSGPPGVSRNVARAKTFYAGDPELAQLEQLAASGRFAPDDQLYLHFALGKALDDVGDHDRAFAHWRAGNAPKRRQCRYNEAAYQKNFQILASLFDAKLLGRFAAAGDPSQLPIFVVGMPAAGTALSRESWPIIPRSYCSAKRTICAALPITRSWPMADRSRFRRSCRS